MKLTLILQAIPQFPMLISFFSLLLNSVAPVQGEDVLGGAHLITILINRPRRCEREAIIMQMNDDFSTLNCFVSWLC